MQMHMLDYKILIILQNVACELINIFLIFLEKYLTDAWSWLVVNSPALIFLTNKSIHVYLYLPTLRSFLRSQTPLACEALGPGFGVLGPRSA